MSSRPVISVRDLGKRYRRGSAARQHDSVRDLIRHSAAALFDRKGGREEDGTFWALKNASFDIRRGENVGIIGLNGAGKSTLLKILSRITTPTTGHARIEGRMGALLEVGTGFHPELTGRENTFLYGAILGMGREEITRKFDAIVDFAEIAEFIDTPVKRYSSGMYVRLAFSVAAHLDPDILLLDEVLAVGDYTFQRKCMDFARKLEAKGSTILFVSHNMFQIKTMCQRVIYLQKGQVVQDGPTEEGLRRYEDDCRLAPAPWFSADDTLPKVEITFVTLRNENGEEQSVFERGERMRVQITYVAPHPISQPDVRIGINRQDDLHCCTFSSLVDRVDLPTLQGEGSIELITPPLDLVAERYTTTITVREKQYGRMVCALLGATFHIKDPVLTPIAYGVFHQPGVWRVSGSLPPAGAAASDRREQMAAT